MVTSRRRRISWNAMVIDGAGNSGERDLGDRDCDNCVTDIDGS